jgi:16S rRNA C967 or C1407 C5-methylase (RsmB/RsmF family)/NOL1/NOP2/fmu family ribosome biogenesis protein
MTVLPADFIKKIEQQFPDQASAIITALDDASYTSFRLNPSKSTANPFDNTSPISWADNAFFLAERPSFTFDPLFHAGAYYVQEASSMFIAEIFKQHVDTNNALKVLDLCAAPGGKSTHILSLISDNSFLIANETIAQRANILAENCTRWGNANVIVCNNDPAHFTDFENCFDVVVIDAPCSGEGMFRKDPAARLEWNEGNVKLCSARQQRILEEATKLVKPGGILIYSTCTFSEEEDEMQILPLISSGDWESLALNCNAFPEITISKLNNIHAYKFLPHQNKGEGFFVSAIRKSNNFSEGNWPRLSKKINFADKKSKAIAAQFLTAKDPEFIVHQDQILFIPKEISAQMLGVLNTKLHIKKFGTEVGQLIREELIPSQALAMSNYRSDLLPSIELSYDDAILYLQKNDMPSQGNAKGWHLMKYKNYALGWAKLLGNRINNAYPKEWRIRKQENS